MTFVDSKSITIDDFLGLLTTERPQNCPVDFATVANNVSYYGGKAGSREGTSTLLNLGSGITDIYGSRFLYFNGIRYFLFLAQDYKLYYSTEAAPTAVLLYDCSATSPTRFTLTVYGNLVFIFFSVAGTSTFGSTPPVVWDPTKLPTVQVDIMTILPEPNILTKATAALTSTGTNVSDGDTVTVELDSFATFGAQSFVYTFKDAFSVDQGVPFEVLIGVDAPTSLANLKAAMNHDPSGEGSLYGLNTTDLYVLWTVLSLTSTVLTLQAQQSGASQNGINVSTTASELSWRAGTFTGGDGFDGADGDAGQCTPGYHGVRIIYQTRTGYFTSPSDARVCLVRGNAMLPMSEVAPYSGATGHDAAECVARILIMTQAFGDPNDLSSMLDRQNWLDALNGTYFTALTIPDNTSTTGTIDIADPQLLEELNWTNSFQYMSPLPNLSIGTIYHERLAACGEAATPSLLYLSELGSPQTFRADIGFLDVKKEDGVNTVLPFVIRDVLHAVKEIGMYSWMDNGSTPDTWFMATVSEEVGTNTLYGVAKESDEEFAAILDFRGLYYFNGGIPEKVSTGLIPTFESINLAKMSWAEIHIDTKKRRVHCLVPTGVNTRLSQSFTADYSNGWGDKAKWSVWYPQTRSWRSMMIDTGGYRVLVCLDSKNVQMLDDTQITDNGIAIDFAHRTGIAEAAKAGLNLFSGIDLQATGTGNLGVKVYGPTGTLIKTASVIALTATPERDFTRNWVLRKERVFIELYHNDVLASSAIDRMTIFVKPDGVRAH